jgi:hypothetical protein
MIASRSLGDRKNVSTAICAFKAYRETQQRRPSQEGGRYDLRPYAAKIPA